LKLPFGGANQQHNVIMMQTHVAAATFPQIAANIIIPLLAIKYWLMLMRRESCKSLKLAATQLLCEGGGSGF